MAITDLARDNLHVPAEITALIAEYAHVIDSGRFEEWPDLFTDPCLYRITTRQNMDRGLPLSIILCDSRGMLLDRVVSVRTANVFIPHSYRHMVSCIQLMESGTDEWRLRSNYLVTRTMPDGTMCVFSTGEYRDHVVLVAGEPKFKERVVICDHSMINNLIAMPL
jgi:anthranilate 1,2-dioxygenase small subunit